MAVVSPLGRVLMATNSVIVRIVVQVTHVQQMLVVGAATVVVQAAVF